MCPDAKMLTGCEYLHCNWSKTSGVRNIFNMNKKTNATKESVCTSNTTKKKSAKHFCEVKWQLFTWSSSKWTACYPANTDRPPWCSCTNNITRRLLGLPTETKNGASPSLIQHLFTQLLLFLPPLHRSPPRGHASEILTCKWTTGFLWSNVMVLSASTVSPARPKHNK